MKRSDQAIEARLRGPSIGDRISDMVQLIDTMKALMQRHYAVCRRKGDA